MFFAGMALGAMAGAALGIGIMCCVVAGKQEDQRMEQIRIRRQKQGKTGMGKRNSLLVYSQPIGRRTYYGRGRNRTISCII